MTRRMPTAPLPALLLLAIAASGCGGGSQARDAWVDQVPLPPDTMTVPLREVGVHGGRFVIGQISSPKTFNAPLANESSSNDVCNQLYASLTDWDNETHEDRPQVAKRWEVSPDGTVYTFHLRRGAAFSDGHPLTAADVLFSFDIVFDENLHPSVQDLLQIGGRRFEVSAPDSYTVVVRTPQVSRIALSGISSVRIMPKHVLEPALRSGTYSSAYSTSTAPESLVTSGPWRLKQFRQNEITVLERNPYWFEVDERGRRLPYLDELVFLIVPDQNTAALKFEAGEVDALDDPKPENYQSYVDNQQKGNYTFYDLGPALNTNFFWFNMNKVRDGKAGKPIGTPYVDAVRYRWFTNPTFRKAVSKAIDRDAIIRSVYYGHAVKNWSTTTPGNKVWHSSDVVHYDYDLEGARQLLAGMGWKDSNGDGVIEDDRGNPVSFTLKTNSSNLLRVSMMNFVKDDLAKIGIRVAPSPMEFNSLITNLREDFQYESIMLGLSSAVPPDPGMGQNVWRSSGLTHYWNVKQPSPETAAEAEIDRLMDVNVESLDLATRLQSWKQIQNIVNEQCFIQWLPVLVYKIPVRNRFGNVHPTVIPHRIIWNIDRVFVKPRA